MKNPHFTRPCLRYLPSEPSSESVSHCRNTITDMPCSQTRLSSASQPNSTVQIAHSSVSIVRC